MNKKSFEKILDYYMSLKYPIKVKEMEEGGYFVEVPDLPGCMCDADTLEEIPMKVEKAKRAWIEGTLERGGEVPLPKSDELYSGRFIVRMPRSLHRTLAERAKEEGVSLNSHVCRLLTLNSERRRIETLLEDIKQMMVTSVWDKAKVSYRRNTKKLQYEVDKNQYIQTS